MSNDNLNELSFALDERNLAHVFSAVALCGLASTHREARAELSSCWWTEDGFVLKTTLTSLALFESANEFVRSIRWVEGLGSAEQGTFCASDEVGSNPFIKLADSGKQRCPLYTFSARVKPGSLIAEQQTSLNSPSEDSRWLEQVKIGVGSWGFDYRVNSHAYDLGFSSDAEQSGDQDPIFPAIELLSIAASAFYADVHGWQTDPTTIRYFVWCEPVSLALVGYAVAGRLNGLSGRSYLATNRGAAYGKGAAYRFFPDAIPEPKKDLNNDRRREKQRQT
ncbi:MAG: hypothetical protein ACR2NN_14745 [Bryobacteraceae bacterium]